MRLPAFASSGQLVSIFALLAGSAAGTAITVSSNCSPASLRVIRLSSVSVADTNHVPFPPQVPGQWSNTLLGNACPSTSTAQFFDISGLQCVPCLNNTVRFSRGASVLALHAALRARKPGGCHPISGTGHSFASPAWLVQVPRSDGLGCQCRTGHVLRGLPTPLAISPGRACPFAVELPCRAPLCAP